MMLGWGGVLHRNVIQFSKKLLSATVRAISGWPVGLVSKFEYDWPVYGMTRSAKPDHSQISLKMGFELGLEPARPGPAPTNSNVDKSDDTILWAWLADHLSLFVCPHLPNNTKIHKQPSIIGPLSFWLSLLFSLLPLLLILQLA